MSYNPFANGEYPVGVRTIELTGKDNNYTAEVWYPAGDEFRGIEAVDTFKYVDELPPATQNASRNVRSRGTRQPLVLYWHGGYGHRRESAAMCVFLASHGFIVASADFPGDHVTHMFGSDPLVAQKPVDESAIARPTQAAEIVELLLASDDEFLRNVIDPDAGVGSFGMSLGGFTTLGVNSTSTRVKASVPICPMTGTRSFIPGIKRLSPFLRTSNWTSEASTFVLTGSDDCFVIVDDVRDLFARIPEPKRLAVLNGAGHLHWADNAEFIHESFRTRYASGEFPDPEIDGPKLAAAMRPFSELCPAEHATDTMRAITLAHFEANLKDRAEAVAFLGADLRGEFEKRGIDLEISEAGKAAGK